MRNALRIVRPAPETLDDELTWLRERVRRLTDEQFTALSCLVDYIPVAGRIEDAS